MLVTLWVSVSMLAAAMVASTEDCSDTSAMTIVPEKSRKRPPVLAIIMCRATNWISEWAGSMLQRPGGGISRPATVLVCAACTVISTPVRPVPLIL
jgi:hypothetical protein